MLTACTTETAERKLPRVMTTLDGDLFDCVCHAFDGNPDEAFGNAGWRHGLICLTLDFIG